MEDDAVYNTWLHQSFSGKLKFRKLENNLYELDDKDRKPSTSRTYHVLHRTAQPGQGRYSYLIAR